MHLALLQLWLMGTLSIFPDSHALTTAFTDPENDPDSRGNWSASLNEVSQAKCLARTLPSETAMRDFLSSQLRSSRVVTRVILGKSFTDTVAALSSLELLARAQSKSPAPIDQAVSANCSQVECALNGLFGPGIGLKLFYLHVKYGLNASHYGITNADPWKEDELNDIFLAMASLPHSMLPLPNRDKQITHFKRGYSGFSGPNTLANSSIMVYDTWNSFPPLMRQYALVHEIGHNISDVLGDLDSSSSWKALFKASSPESLVSNYAKTNPAEDFAETFSAYRFNPSHLKAVNPQKYEQMKHIFDGIEYDSEENCARPSHAQTAIRGLDWEEILDSSERPVMVGVFSSCREEILDSILSSVVDLGQTSNKSKQCLIEAALKSLYVSKHNLSKEEKTWFIPRNANLSPQEIAEREPLLKFVQTAWIDTLQELVVTRDKLFWSVFDAPEIQKKISEKSFCSVWAWNSANATQKVTRLIQDTSFYSSVEMRNRIALGIEGWMKTFCETAYPQPAPTQRLQKDQLLEILNRKLAG